MYSYSVVVPQDLVVDTSGHHSSGIGARYYWGRAVASKAAVGLLRVILFQCNCFLMSNIC